MKPGKVDITPSWATAVEILLTVLEDGTEEGKKEARAEVRRMGTILDRVVVKYGKVVEL